MASSARQMRTPMAILVSLVLALLLFATTGVSQAQAAEYQRTSLPYCGGTHNSGSSDRAGNVYIACGTTTSSDIYRYAPDGSRVKLTAQTLPFFVSDVAPTQDGSKLYLSEAVSGGRATKIRRMEQQTVNSYALSDAWSGGTWKLGDYTHNTKTYVPKGYKLTTDDAGNIYVADGASSNADQTDPNGGDISLILKYSPSGTLLTKFGGNAIKGGPFDGLLAGIDVSADGNKLYALEGNCALLGCADKGNHLMRFDKRAGTGETGTYDIVGTPFGGVPDVGEEQCKYYDVGDPNVAWQGHFAAPWDVGLDGNGNVYVLHASCNEVLKFSPNLAPQNGMKVGGIFLNNEPHHGRAHGLAVSKNGEVYVGEASLNSFGSDSAKMKDIAIPTATVAPDTNATGVAVTSSVTATFSEFMDKASLSDANFTLKKNGAAVNVTGAISFDDVYTPRVATLKPTNALEAGVSYTATLSGVKDVAGNALPPKTWTFTTANVVDPTPNTLISSGPAEGSSTTNTTASFSFSADPAAGASFECKLDGAAYAACTSPKEYTALPAGQHTFSVRAKNSGGTDATPAARSWEVTKPPDGETCQGKAPTPVARSTKPDGTVVLTGTDGADVIIGTAGKDQIFGKVGNDTICGGGGFDTISGGPGDDALDGGTGPNGLEYGPATAAVSVNLATGKATGEGTDTLANFNEVYGSPQADTMVGNGAVNFLAGSGGNDKLYGSGGDDLLRGGDGYDSFRGGVGNDTLEGQAGGGNADYADAPSAVSVNLKAGSASGGAGSDKLVGLLDATGSRYNDTIVGSSSSNSFVGGAGVDTASYAGSTTAVKVDLSLTINQATGQGNDRLAGMERLFGSAYNDTLIGNGLNNVLAGHGGNDKLYGRLGNDGLSGGAGADSLYGEGGNDFLNSKDGFNGNDSLDGGTGTDTKATDTTEKAIKGFP